MLDLGDVQRIHALILRTDLKGHEAEPVAELLKKLAALGQEMVKAQLREG
jgi:hypothetical protein